ncbi:MAG: YciI family protein [Sneathiellaceae bacterium]
MLYALLIFESEEAMERQTPAEFDSMMAAHGRMQDAAKEAGAFRGGVKLMPSSSASTLRAGTGDAQVLDGPFAETKELLVGFYLVECDSLDQAIEHGRRLPHLAGGAVEIRPVQYLTSLLAGEAFRWSSSD